MAEGSGLRVEIPCRGLQVCWTAVELQAQRKQALQRGRRPPRRFDKIGGSAALG